MKAIVQEAAEANVRTEVPKSHLEKSESRVSNDEKE